MKHRVVCLDSATGAEIPYAQVASRKDALVIAEHLRYFRVRDPNGKVIAQQAPPPAPPGARE